MLVDAAKGLEPQTLKLFRVCRRYGLPIITVVNKWDRPGLEPLELLDQIQSEIDLTPTPLTWPIGDAGDFTGVLDRTSTTARLFTRTAGGATRAPERVVDASQVPPEAREQWQRALEEHRAAHPRRAAATTPARSWPAERHRWSSSRPCSTSVSPNCSTSSPP